MKVVIVHAVMGEKAINAAMNKIPRSRETSSPSHQSGKLTS
jgi:hypothetical protein